MIITASPNGNGQTHLGHGKPKLTERVESICGHTKRSLNTKLKNWFISIIYGISFIPNIVVLSFFLINNYIMNSTDFFVIFDTNPNEAFGFFDTLSLKMVVYVFIYIIIGLLLFLRALKTSGNNAKRYISIISLIFFLFIPFLL